MECYSSTLLGTSYIYTSGYAEVYSSISIEYIGTMNPAMVKSALGNGADPCSGSTLTNSCRLSITEAIYTRQLARVEHLAARKKDLEHQLRTKPPFLQPPLLKDLLQCTIEHLQRAQVMLERSKQQLVEEALVENEIQAPTKPFHRPEPLQPHLVYLGLHSSYSSGSNLCMAYNDMSIALMPAYMPTPTLLMDKGSDNHGYKPSEDEDCYANITDGPLKLKLVAFDSRVREIPIYEGSKTTIGDVEGKAFAFEDGLTPPTIQLSYHVQECFLRAFRMGGFPATSSQMTLDLL